MNLFFPGTIYCAACGGLLSGGKGLALCEACAEELRFPEGRVCAKCGKPLRAESEADCCGDCESLGHIFSQGFAATCYSGFAMALVRDMKYRDRPYYAPVITELMSERWRSFVDPETGETPQFDILTNVPVSPKKKKYRGFDQAELVASALAGKIGTPFAPGLLRRVRDTAVQSSLSIGERRANLKGAFAVSVASRGEVAGK
ncbi:MAG: double zinc ribbon domain-containing protein, partial [Clostridiales Family XIII bacterium]|nr:double zinc ribbon domain-containing protein [Clostridiales Family XIII bacterium]